MRLTETPLPGAWLIEPERIGDERGWFARIYDEQTFRAHGIEVGIRQSSLSFNRRRGTLRGMHYQAVPHAEPKLVRCVRGAIYDVGLDLRPDSPSYLGWYGTELSAENRHALYLPPGLAHGFQSLTDDAEVLYEIGAEYVPGAARGVRYDDPAFGIRWPEASGGRVISERDRSYPDFDPSSPP